jgi:hypothetical protein
MSRVLCLLMYVSSFALAQTSNIQSNGSAPSSAVEVVYTIDGSTLTTYNVDPQTLQAAEVGSIILSESTYPYLITSSNGHFLYYERFRITPAPVAICTSTIPTRRACRAQRQCRKSMPHGCMEWRCIRRAGFCIRWHKAAAQMV